MVLILDSIREPDVSCSSLTVASAKAKDIDIEQETGMLSSTLFLVAKANEQIEISSLACSTNMCNIRIQRSSVSFSTII